MKRFYFTLILAMSAGIIFIQAQDSTKVSIPAEFASWNVQQHELRNGLKILTLEDHSAPVVTFQMWTHTGSRNERPGITGISHLFEHMMFKGSKKYGAEEHANIVQRNGGNLNAFTTEDVTVYFENIVPDKLELIVSLEAERLANLNISDSTLASEREVVKEERRYRVENDNFGLVYEQLLSNAFLAHPYQWSIVGWMSDLDAITVSDCKEYHRVHYAPNNVTLVIVGDFKTAEALKMVDKYFGKIPAQEAATPVTTVEPRQLGERIAYVKRQAQLPMLVAGYHTPDFKADDYYVLQVLQKILSDGRSSRLYKKLVYEEQVALYAGGGLSDTEDPGLFYLYLGMNPGCDIDKGKKMLFAEVERFATEEVSDKELQKARNQLEADLIMSMQSNMRKGLNLGDYQVRGGDYKLLFTAAEKYQKVTKADIIRIAKEYMNEDNRTVVILIPQKES